MNTITLKTVEKFLPALLSAKVVPFLHSSPAIGKSSIAKAVAKQYGLKVIDLRLTEMESSDLNGLPKTDAEKAYFQPYNTFPLKDTPIPDGYNGWLLLLDEVNSALPSVQAAAYKLILDRMVGQYPLHDNVAIIACGNLDTDNAITYPMSSALVSRFAHFYIEVDDKEWYDWAVEHGIDSRITSFIGFRPSLIYTFNPDSVEPYAAPRTWEMLSRVIKGTQVTKEQLPLVASMVGLGTATEFLQFIELYKEIPKLEDILANPGICPIPTSLGTQWAVIGMLLENITSDNYAECQTYLKRLNSEQQFVAMRSIYKRHPSLISKTTAWAKELSVDIFL